MAKKTPKNTKMKNSKFIIKTESGSASETCCEKRWNLIPLRFALGLMFLAAGLPKLLSLINGGTQIPAFFAGLGIPLAGFFAWVVAIAEVVGGVFLLLGFMTWWTGLILAIIMVVATLLTTLHPLNWGNLTKHLVFIAGLIAVMYGSKGYSIIKWNKCCCMKKH